MEEFFEEKPGKQKNQVKHIFHLHRRLFLLVLAVAVLGQSVLFVSTRLNRYYKELENSFKIIFTVNTKSTNDALNQIGESLNQKTDITGVRLFSPQDGLEAVRKQNPQLAESLLLMGKDKMPAYFEVKVNFRALNNIRPFVDNLSSEYPLLSARYNVEHADMIFYVGLCAKLLRLSVSFSLLLFLAFMFLVEAYPSREKRSHYVGGAVSGILAALCACLFFAGLVYPTGFLAEAFAQFTNPFLQILLIAFCGLFGWTLSKWQKF